MNQFVIKKGLLKNQKNKYTTQQWGILDEILGEKMNIRKI